VVSLARAVERSGDRGRAVSVAGRLHPGCANAARVLDQADQERTAHGMPAGSTVVDRISFLTLFISFFIFVVMSLHGHMKYHDVRGWLLRGAKREDARTIYRAIKRMPTRRLIRRLARMLDDARR